MNKAIKTIVTVLLVVGFCNEPTLYALVWDGGYHEFSEGSEAEVWMSNDATADITGGEIGILECYVTSSVFVYEPSEIGLLRPADSSMANVYGGTIFQLFSLGSSTTNIYGDSLDWLGAKDYSTVNLFVDNYVLDPTGGDFGDGLLTGTWLYGGSFSISLVTEGSFDHINFVPEPTSISLLAIGTALFRFHMRKKTYKESQQP